MRPSHTPRRSRGQQHDVWDIRTDKARWWVVTGMTNLYSQDDFTSRRSGTRR